MINYSTKLVCRLFLSLSIAAGLASAAIAITPLQAPLFHQTLEEMIAIDTGHDEVIANYNVSSNINDDLQIEEIKYDANHNQFIAYVKSLGGNEFEISGKYEPAELIPVLINPVQIGQKITEDNIGFSKLSLKQNLSQIFRTVDSIVGRYAKHNILANRPLFFQDLGEETLMQKGQTVKIIFERNNLSVEGIGTTLEAGALGDMIRVKNIDSGKILTARVKSSEVVAVSDLKG